MTTATARPSFEQAAAQASANLTVLRALEPSVVAVLDRAGLRARVFSAKDELVRAAVELRAITGSDHGDIREDYPNLRLPYPQNGEEARRMFLDARAAVLGGMDALTKCPSSQPELRKALALGVQGVMVNAIHLSRELAEFLEPQGPLIVTMPAQANVPSC